MSKREEMIEKLSKKWKKVDARWFITSAKAHKIATKERVKIVQEMTEATTEFAEEAEKIVSLILKMIDERATENVL